MLPLTLKIVFALFICFEFAVLIILGFIWLRLLYWTDLFRHSRDGWFRKMKITARVIRGIRVQVEEFDSALPGIPWVLKFRRQIRLFRWISIIYGFIQNNKKRPSLLFR